MKQTIVNPYMTGRLIYISAYYSRMSNFSLHLISGRGYDTPCAQYTEDRPVDPGRSVTMQCSGTGRYVKVRRDTGTEISRIVICEVVVFGYPTHSESKQECKSPGVNHKGAAL